MSRSSMFSFVSKLNVLDTPLTLRVEKKKTPDSSKDIVANAPKAEMGADLLTALMFKMIAPSPATFIHLVLLMLQESALASFQLSPDNLPIITQRLRELANLLETATPEQIEAAREDRDNAALLVQSLDKTDSSTTVN